MSKIYIRTFGCQMNDRDSEALLGLFLQKGYAQAKSEEDAEVILINTCSVRDHAENRALSLLGTYKKLKNSKFEIRNSKLIIGLIGCMAKNKGDEIFSKMPHIDLVCGPAAFFKIPEYVERIKRSKRSERSPERLKEVLSEAEGRPKGVEGDKGLRIKDLKDTERDENFYGAAFRQEVDHAQVVISTGCSNFCSYCIVPYTRGKLRPRNPKNIITEIKHNIKQGRRKITLLGQNVNDYRSTFNVQRSTFDRKGSIDFVDLLKEIDKVEGLKELDFVTSHPKNTSKELFRVMAESDKIKKHLHLPFQSGSNRILKLMGRGYSREEYIELINQYKQITGGTLGTDVIIGFPSETEADFNQTKSLVEEVGFKYAFIFKYSPRLRTKAAEMDDDVPEKVKSRRHKELLDLQKKISRTV
ncbi:MAG: tRNA (N6-isopentenyl adenosine(37)-C2)-methylthiotransferase MiaB [Candidatus Omnitrophica bacterium]|nr:tRNA (N6-isopentenyl adenosine(37)-C2)-methylthiotransferase MiaB [Candidatus Omnitrophota bacterium]